MNTGYETNDKNYIFIIGACLRGAESGSKNDGQDDGETQQPGTCLLHILKAKLKGIMRAEFITERKRKEILNLQCSRFSDKNEIVSQLML